MLLRNTLRGLFQFILCHRFFTLLSSAVFMLWAIEVAQRYQEQTRLNVSNCTRLKFGSDLTFAIVNFNISTYSMFALYPRSWYYSGAALEVRSVALLHTFLRCRCQRAVLRHGWDESYLLSSLFSLSFSSSTSSRSMAGIVTSNANLSCALAVEITD